MILGVDPGQSGALALLGGNSVEVFDMPVMEIGKRRIIDALALARWVDEKAATIDQVWLEYSFSRPTDGGVQAFKFGENYGIVRGVLAANFLRVEVVHPAKWKRAMGVLGDKDEARAAACRLFPRQSALFARKKDDGRAEACLIATYGARQ